MKVREFLNQNSSIGILAAVVLLVISLFIIYREISGTGGPQPPSDKYFLDLNTGEIFVGDMQAIPPIETPSGPYEGEPAGVVAHIYTCGDCEKNYAGMQADEVQRSGAKIAYLTKHTPEGKRTIERMQSGEVSPEEMGEEDMYFSEMVGEPDGDRWYSMDEDPEAQQLYENLPDCPEGEQLRQCFPGRR
ncbi:MAG: hypothetical protein ACOC1G_06215 [Phycisphaeraceae bacterium]